MGIFLWSIDAQKNKALKTLPESNRISLNEIKLICVQLNAILSNILYSA